MYKKVIAAILSMACLAPAANAQKEFDGLRGTHKWMMFSDAPNALYHHLANQAFNYLNERAARVAALRTLTDWQQWQEQVRAGLKAALGPFPEKTALNPVVTSLIDKGSYRVENLYFESRPGFKVTASLFIPRTEKKKKMPAIIYCSGHAETGYRTASYQHTILNLVNKGFIVLAFDPIGQGERLQYANPQTGKSRFEYPSYEHSYAGAQLFMTGNSLAGYMIWDGIRAIDYLQSRKEVDTSRIGITGRSGGGTQSAFIAAVDQRIKAVAPENYFSSFTRLYQSIGPQDAEQNFLNGIKKGLDMADLLLVYAPKPALMITTTRDMFPIQGAIETAEEVSRIYQVYGSSGNFKMVSDDAPHAATKKNREAMYAFFQKFLSQPGNAADREISALSPEELKVMPGGQVTGPLKSETVFSLNKKSGEVLFRKLQKLRKSPDYQNTILQTARRYSGYREPDTLISPVFTGRIQREGYTIEKYFIKGEGNYVIPYLMMKPDKPASKAILYLNPRGKATDSDTGGTMEWLVKKGFTVLAPDLIGSGEMGPGVFKGDSYIASVPYNLWFSALQIGRSITGIHAADMVKLERLLTQQNIAEVYGLAHRELAPALLHAAAFDKNIRRIALIRPYSSYQSVIDQENYHPDFLYSTVAAAAGKYDLPDLAAALAPRKLLLFGTTDGAGTSGDVTADMKVIDNGYRLKEGLLQLVPAGPDEKLTESLKNWIK